MQGKIFSIRYILIDEYFCPRAVNAARECVSTCEFVNEEYVIEVVFDPRDTDTNRQFAIGQNGIWIKCEIDLHDAVHMLTGSYTLTKDELNSRIESAKSSADNLSCAQRTVDIECKINGMSRVWRDQIKMSVTFEKFRNEWFIESIVIVLSKAAGDAWWKFVNNWRHQITPYRALCAECHKSDCICRAGLSK